MADKPNDWGLRRWCLAVLRVVFPGPPPDLATAPELAARLAVIQYEAAIMLVDLEMLPMIGDHSRRFIMQFAERVLRICEGKDAKGRDRDA